MFLMCHRCIMHRIFVAQRQGRPKLNKCTSSWWPFFPGEPASACQISVLFICILCVHHLQIYITLHIVDIIPPTSKVIQCLWPSHLSAHRSTSVNYLTLIFISSNWLAPIPSSLSLHFSSFFQCKTTHPSMYTHFSSIWLNLAFHFKS